MMDKIKDLEDLLSHLSAGAIIQNHGGVPVVADVKLGIRKTIPIPIAEEYIKYIRNLKTFL
jgi:hypothetical protein